MKVVRFLFYYVGKVISVWFGWRYTDKPLGLKWRWKYWKKIQKSKDKKLNAYK